MNWYLIVLKKYAVFGGRARRKEYWYYILFAIIINTILATIDILVGFWDEQSGGPALMGIVVLGTIIPTLAVSVRRLHDTGRSGWWLLILLIPFIGGFGWFWLATQRGTPRANNYGPDPISTPEHPTAA